MALKRKFSAKAYRLTEYQKVGATVFPKEISVAFAVCSVRCGARQFIVDGSTQVCEYCGRSMFRTEVETYALKSKVRKKKKPNQALQPNAGAAPFADEALPPRG